MRKIPPIIFAVVGAPVAALLAFSYTGMPFSSAVEVPKSLEALLPAAKPEQPISALFIGDVMLDRAVALHAVAHGDASLVAPQVRDLFQSADAVIANHEGTITTNASVSIADHSTLRFTFDPRFAAFLKQLGIRAVSLSNNHTFDFGAEGYASTKAYLAQAGIQTFGSPHNDDELSTKLLVQGKILCLVGYEGFINADPAPIAEEITRIRPECDFVIATMHAGEEYFAGHTSLQEKAAHAFVDAGADAVIGTHPHIVEPLEIYKGKAIFYSLGNFLFDQNFSYETTHGLVVQISFGREGLAYTLVPIVIQNQEVSLPSTDDATRTLRALIDDSLSRELATQILSHHEFSLP